MSVIVDLREQLRELEVEGVEETDKELGRGAYGVVVEFKVNGLRCAGKKLHETFFSETSRRERQSIIARFAEECLTHSKLRHPNIVQLIGVYYTPGSRVPTLVMELMPLSLASALEQYPDIPSHVKNVILLDVSLGLYFLHNRTPPIIHRDLTANNVLLSESMRAKIADLGVARIVNINPAQMSMRMTATPGTPCYMPPEAFIAKPVYDAKLDVFSMGNLIIHVSIQEWPIPLMEMFCPDPDHPGRLIAVTEVERRADYLDRMGEGHPLTSLATRCLQNDPRVRPTTSEIVQEVEDAIANNPPPFPNTLEMLQRIKNLDGNVQSLEAGNTNLEAQMKSLEAGNTDLEAQVKSLEAGNTNLEAQVKSLEAGNTNLEAQVKCLEAGNTDLKAQVKSLEVRNTNLEAQVKILEAGNMNLEAQMKILEAGNRNFEAQVKSLEVGNTNLEAQVKSLQAEKNREISALQQENAILVKAAATQKETSTVVKAAATQKEVSTAVKAAATQKEPSTAVKAAPTQKEPSTAVKAAATQKEASRAVKAAATQKEPSTVVKAAATQKEISTDVKAPTQKELSTDVKAAATQKEPSTAVEPKYIAAEEEDQEHVPVKAATLKEDTPTSKVVATVSVFEQENTTAAAHEIEQEITPVKATTSTLEKTDKELGRGAYSEDEDYVDPEYLPRERIYFPKEETRQAKKRPRQWRKTWKRQFQKLVKKSKSKPEEAITEGQEPKKDCTENAHSLSDVKQDKESDYPGKLLSTLSGERLTTRQSEDKGVPTPKEPNYPLYVGKFDWDGREDDDLSFKKGDLMCILNTDDDDGWWLARSKETGKEGYIPSNHVAEWESLEAEEWFSNISRIEAEELLMKPPNQHGSFLVRESETLPGCYSISVRNKETIQNYRIRQLDDGNFFITRRATFDTIQALIHHYEQQADGLYCVLRHTCLSQEKPQTAGLSRKANMECELNRDQIRLVGKLGAGTYGEVWEGSWKATTAVAIKALKPGTSPPTEEIKYLVKLHHPKLVQVYGACTKEEPVYVVMELMKQGSLREYLWEKRRSLKLPQLIDMAAQVAAGMAYLEEQYCTHHNLAARNILVGEGNICKVADFGMIWITGEELTGEHSIKWTAPEAILYNRFTIKSDVWSMGVVLGEIITYGRFPYPGMTNAQVIEAVQQGYRMPCPTGCPEELYDMMLYCWREEPDARPTFETLQWQLEEFFIPDQDPIFADPKTLF